MTSDGSRNSMFAEPEYRLTSKHPVHNIEYSGREFVEEICNLSDDDLSKLNTDFYIGQKVRLKYKLDDGYEVWQKGSVGIINCIPKGTPYWVTLQMRKDVDVDVRTYGVEPIEFEIDDIDVLITNV